MGRQKVMLRHISINPLQRNDQMLQLTYDETSWQVGRNFSSSPHLILLLLSCLRIHRYLKTQARLSNGMVMLSHTGYRRTGNDSQSTSTKNSTIIPFYTINNHQHHTHPHYNHHHHQHSCRLQRRPRMQQTLPSMLLHCRHLHC